MHQMLTLSIFKEIHVMHYNPLTTRTSIHFFITMFDSDVESTRLRGNEQVLDRVHPLLSITQFAQEQLYEVYLKVKRDNFQLQDDNKKLKLQIITLGVHSPLSASQ